MISSEDIESKKFLCSLEEQPPSPPPLPLARQPSNSTATRIQLSHFHTIQLQSMAHPCCLSQAPISHFLPSSCTSNSNSNPRKDLGLPSSQSCRRHCPPKSSGWGPHAAACAEHHPNGGPAGAAAVAGEGAVRHQNEEPARGSPLVVDADVGAAEGGELAAAPRPRTALETSCP